MTDYLSVLDMSEDGQRDFVRNILIDTYYSNWMLDQWDKGRFSLADLAFRLRDKAIKENLTGYPNGYMECQRIVWIHVINPSQYDDIPADKSSGGWWAYYAKPIHWVIACLIAKGKANE